MTVPLQRAARAYALLLGLGALAILAVAALWTPEELARGLPLARLGFAPAPCAGCFACGLSRAFSAALHLEPARALAFHPGVLLALPACVGMAVAGPWIFARGLERRTGARR